MKLGVPLLLSLTQIIAVASSCSQDASQMAAWAAIIEVNSGVLPKQWSSHNTTSLCTNWEGVACNKCIGSSLRDYCCVSSVNLENFDFGRPMTLSAFINPIISLSSLQLLSLSFTQLTGTLPPLLGNLKNLQVLDLAGNSLVGVLPSELGNMASLQELHLQQIPPFSLSRRGLGQRGLLPAYLRGEKYGFIGALPSSWSRMSALKVLDLSTNALQSSLPLQWGTLSSLEKLLLTDNFINGSLPVDWPATLTKLQVLDLSHNNIDGNLPDSWGSWDSITSLSLWNNSLGGELPSAWSSMGNLEVLQLSVNQFETTSLPASWSELTNLTTLQIDRNSGISGSLPVQWGRMASLQYLDVSKCSISGPLPASYGALSKLQRLIGFGNHFDGQLSVEWSGMVSLVELNLHHNSLQGSLPVEWTTLTRIEQLQLQGNKISGQIPHMWGQHMTKLYLVDLSSNQFTGSLPQWSNLKTSLSILNLYGNQISGSLDASYSSLAMLLELRLQNNMLSGSLSPEWAAGMAKLGLLSLSGNLLEEALPPEWGAFPSLRFLDLSHNGFSNLLPTEWGSFVGIQELYLSNNNLQGNLPATWGGFLSLQILDLSFNQLIGNLPPEFSGLTFLQQINLANNALQGQLPDEWGTMQSLISLDLSSNEFDHILPSSWSIMTQLQLLDLSKNQLSGALPPEWSYMMSLQVMDLSSNFLVGPLEKSWGQLTALQKLSLSGNNLVGTLPSEWRSLVKLKSFAIAYNPAFVINEQAFTTLPARSLVSLDFSGTGQAGGLGSISSITKDSLQKLINLDQPIIVKIEGVSLFCPLPDKSTIGTVVLITSACLPPLHQATVPSAIIGGALIVLLLIVRLSSSLRQLLTRLRTSDRWRRLVWAGILMLAAYDIIADVISYGSMTNTVLATLNTPDDCQSVNSRSFYELGLTWRFMNNEMPIEFDHPIAVTEYPGRYDNGGSFYNTTDVMWNFVSFEYSTFQEFLAWLRRGWPAEQYPQRVATDIEDFRNLCDNFMIFHAKNDKVTSICGFKASANGGSELNRCVRIYDPRAEAVLSFIPFLIASASILILKEGVKVCLIIYMLLRCGGGDDNFMSNSAMLYLRTSPFAILLTLKPRLLALVFRAPDQQKGMDVIFKLMYEGILDNGFQLVLSLYYTLYISQQGLQLMVCLGILNNVLSTIWNVATAIRLCRNERRVRVATVTD